jgi:hypothetical protein
VDLLKERLTVTEKDRRASESQSKATTDCGIEVISLE